LIDKVTYLVVEQGIDIVIAHENRIFFGLQYQHFLHKLALQKSALRMRRQLNFALPFVI